MRQTGAHAYRGPRRRRFPPEIERIIRRRRWVAWAAIAALAAIVFGGGPVPGSGFSNSRAHGIFVAVVLAVWVAAVCLVAVGTFRLRRRGVYTVPFLDAPFSPVRLRASGSRRGEILPEWLLRALVGVAAVACMALTLPNQVNAVADLTDSAPTAVFLPRSYVQDCGKDGCTINTAGMLEDSGLPAVWPGQFPLDRPFPVQAPVVRTGPTLLTGTGAVGYTLLAMVIDTAAVSTLFGYILRLGRRLTSRERPALPRPWLT